MTRTFLALGLTLAATLPAAAQVTATPTGPAVVVPVSYTHLTLPTTPYV